MVRVWRRWSGKTRPGRHKGHHKQKKLPPSALNGKNRATKGDIRAKTAVAATELHKNSLFSFQRGTSTPATTQRYQFPQITSFERVVIELSHRISALSRPCAGFFLSFYFCPLRSTPRAKPAVRRRPTPHGSAAPSGTPLPPPRGEDAHQMGGWHTNVVQLRLPGSR